MYWWKNEVAQVISYIVTVEMGHTTFCFYGFELYNFLKRFTEVEQVCFTLDPSTATFLQL